MKERPTRQPVQLNRRIGIAMAIALLGSLLLAAGALAGAVALTRGASREGELFLWACPIGVIATGMAAFFLFNELGRLSPGLARRSWLGVPRYVWIIGGIGFVFMFVRLVSTVAAFAGWW